MAKGFTGRILRVDLGSRNVSVDEPGESYYRTYLGGAGIVSYVLLKEIPRGTDPLSPQNKLVFAAGPITGLGLAGATRDCVGARSPLTAGYAKSESGGHWPMDFKRTGYDALILEGKAEEPVYLWIDENGRVDIRDAAHLWGKSVPETQDAIVRETGQRGVKTASIGIGGENLVNFACIMNDLKDAHGRGGLGAVMGSKNLKAIAVHGRRSPEVADPDRIREMAKRFARSIRERDNKLFNPGYSDYGTGSAMEMFNEIGLVPAYNFSDSYFDGTDRISPTAIADTVRVGMSGCAACPIRCKREVAFDEPYKADSRLGGPEYETLGSLGSCCGVDDLKAICRANQLANIYSLDTISLGVTISFAMECFESGILTLEDTGGIDLRFGNAEAMLQMVEVIAHRQGLGDLLAKGSRQAAKELGRDAEELAIHVKGLELPMHDPRLKQGMGLIYCVSPAGADHCTGIHDTVFTGENAALDNLRGVGAHDPLPSIDLSPSKVINTKAAHAYNLFLDSVVCCQFVPWTVTDLVDLVRAATGWEYTAYEAVKQGERVATMARLFNLRHGITAAEDRLPARFFSGTRGGALEDVGIDPNEMEDAKRLFYTAMGWDPESGVPTRETLEELGIGWAAECLEPDKGAFAGE